MDNLHTTYKHSLNIHFDASRFTTTNCIVVNRTPLLPTQKQRLPLLTLCSANVQAVKSKTAYSREYIRSIDMDIFAITETWLQEEDTAAKLEIIPVETHNFV